MLVFPKKFIGSCCFDYEPIQIERAIYRSNTEIVIEFNSEGYLYTVSLKSQDGRIFSGQYVATKGRDKSNSEVSARVYWDELGPLLIGNWSENGRATWLARLNEVEHFEDEKA